MTQMGIGMAMIITFIQKNLIVLKMQITTIQIVKDMNICSYKFTKIDLQSNHTTLALNFNDKVKTRRNKQLKNTRSKKDKHKI